MQKKCTHKNKNQNKQQKATGKIRITFPTQYDFSIADNTNIDIRSQDPDYPQIKNENLSVSLFQNILYKIYFDASNKCIVCTTQCLCAKWIPTQRQIEINNISGDIFAGSLRIFIKYIRNPLALPNQSTGNFRIETYVQETLLDQNLNLGRVVFTPFIIPNKYGYIANDGSNLGGFSTNYKVTFSLFQVLPLGTWFRFRFPYEYSFQTLECSIVYTDLATEKIDCAVNDDNVLITGSVSRQMSLGNYDLKIRNVVNPNNADEFKGFILECLFPGTFNVLEFYIIQGSIIIKAGQIKNPQISGNPLNMNLRIDYTIQFTPTNTIPSNGSIKIKFPTLAATSDDPITRRFTLDSICRVTNGLIPLQIEVKIFAVNPGRAATYSPFQIVTYQDSVGTKKIDENTDSGQVTISDINRPQYVQIDLFKVLVNGTFSQTIPLDFRLYPNPGKELALSSSTSKHMIYFQIPIFWRLKGCGFQTNTQAQKLPEALFGNDPAFSVSYNNNIFYIFTPSATNVLKYPPQLGLGQCDLPISLNSVILPGFGGKYFFRSLTFQNYKLASDVPVEQDLFLMDIAIPDLNNCIIQTSGSEAQDPDNVVYASFNVGIAIPYEGAINFNMTSVNVQEENSSRWEFALGFDMPAGIFGKLVPCSVFISGDLCGFKDSNHPNVRCYVFNGNIQQNAILQIRGFSYTINSGTTIQVYIPNIRFCEVETMGCFIQLNTAYTSDIADPYFLNRKTVAVQAKINTKSNINEIANTQNESQPNFGTSKEICVFADWTFPYTFSTGFQSGDSIILKFPYHRWVDDDVFSLKKLQVQNVSSNFGTVTFINHSTTNEIYFYIQVNINVAANTSLQLKNLKNVIDIRDSQDLNVVQGIIVKGVYWQNKKKVGYMKWARSPNFDDGGILGSIIDILPDGTDTQPKRTQSTDMEWKSEVAYRIRFYNCRIIPENGKIKVKIPKGTPDFININPDCIVSKGVQGINNLSIYNDVSCKLDATIPSNNYFIVSGFKQVDQETSIELIFRATNPAKQAATWNPGQYEITSHKTDDTKINFTKTLVNALDVAGPNVFPQYIKWDNFYIQNKLARQGQRGYFVMEIVSPLNFPQGSVITINFGGGVDQPFSNDNFDLQKIKTQGYLYCSIDDQIQEECTIQLNSQELTMKVSKSPKFMNGIVQWQKHTLKFGYRGNDDGASTRDGFLITKADIYDLDFKIQNGGQIAQTSIAYRNLAKSFDDFWIWSMNKISTNTGISYTQCFGGNSKECGMTTIIIRFSISGTILPSIIKNSQNMVTSKTKFIINFESNIDNIFNDGFDSDLGTGLGHRSILPCEGKGFKLLNANIDRLDCKLYQSAKPLPTQIIISDFDQLNAGKYEIHIPKIYNPQKDLELLRISLSVETQSIAGSKKYKFIFFYLFKKIVQVTTIPQYENIYDLVNMTNTLQSHTFHAVPLNLGELTCKPEFDKTDIDTLATLSLCYKTSTHKLQGGDSILFMFPQDWILPSINTVCKNTFTTLDSQCDHYDSAKQILIHLDKNVNAGSEILGKIDMNTPPFKIINTSSSSQVITGYTYWRSRIVAKFKLPKFVQILTELTIKNTDIIIKTSNNIRKEVGEYTIQYNIIKTIPNDGCIQIIIPNDFKGKQKKVFAETPLFQVLTQTLWEYLFLVNQLFQLISQNLFIYLCILLEEQKQVQLILSFLQLISKWKILTLPLLQIGKSNNGIKKKIHQIYQQLLELKIVLRLLILHQFYIGKSKLKQDKKYTQKKLGLQNLRQNYLLRQIIMIRSIFNCQLILLYKMMLNQLVFGIFHYIIMIRCQQNNVLQILQIQLLCLLLYKNILIYLTKIQEILLHHLLLLLQQQQVQIIIMVKTVLKCLFYPVFTNLR
ncbi:hypothetical protein IMG5_153300 [Ichthyophthirius multifiliis]|uniref:Uncharacterized protein n=1 Tax=Ichthyophthirius multifiliis TaxID=5932 RepID=G0QYY7_ICHMU|nr:hypothetical protein IMG5_153300 [Ichthyophthirius multifiliis]EGR29558.1 hypothetical protein IMG5_153300 [Ichthyophthirius multifiliis]|eukprot:XP_004030794.1 hypothetical protein IMG5_153300 [Ichthyophthirius multifiliis]